METTLKLNDKKTNKSEDTNHRAVAKHDSTKKTKRKRDWVAIVHKGCRVCIFRTLEGIFAFLVVTILSLIVGSMILPSISFSMASSAGITQGTDFYTAIALWLVPVLFFALLITAATFCVLRRFLKWLHNYFSGAIRKGNEKDEMIKVGDK